MRSVCILGFSPNTVEYAKTTKTDEYWSMNYGPLLFKDMPQLDRLFEMHKRSWYLRGETKKANKYRRWLNKPHPFPIYMQAEFADKKRVPSSVAYPYDEVVKELLSGIVTVPEQELRPYFTSTAAFMFALAIYEKFDEIHLVGIDMDSDTEYGYQKPCGEFWLGMALGRGIKVVIPQKCTLLSAPLYGYDVVPFIDKMIIAEIVDEYQKRKAVLQVALDEAVKVLNNSDGSDLDAAGDFLKKSAWVYLYEGAIMFCARVIAIKDNYISRQFLEMYKPEYLNAMEFYKGRVNSLKGIIEDVGKDSIDDANWTDYLNSRASMFANWGAVQMINRMLGIIDFRKVNMDLVLNIVEE